MEETIATIMYNHSESKLKGLGKWEILKYLERERERKR
jgi:hypothetical protein